MKKGKWALAVALLALVLVVSAGCSLWPFGGKAEVKQETVYCPACETYMPRDHFLTAHDGQLKHLVAEKGEAK